MILLESWRCRTNKQDRARLSARTLLDVPSDVRIGSPYDASDRDVIKFAERGHLHPQTNFGVVYRVAFSPVLEPDERPGYSMGTRVEGFPTNALFRFGFIVAPHLTDDGTFSLTTD